VALVARRGFFAELAYQQQQTAKRNQQAQRAAERERAAAQRRAEQAARAAERARNQAARQSAQEQKAAQAEAKRLHLEAMAAEVESLNATLAATYDEIDSLLAATLDVDDWVDLEALRTHVQHPPFPHPELEQPVAPPPLPTPPPEPQWVEPEPESGGLSAMFGGKKRHAERVAAARAEFDQRHLHWQTTVAQIPKVREHQLAEHARLDQQRLEALARAHAVYAQECHQHDADAAAANAALDQLVQGLELNVASAVQEYVSIVLSNSVYPPSFPVDYEFEFDGDLGELALAVTVPAPADVPVVREYKYVKAKDEITSTELTQKDRKARYASAVHQVALRSLHEVFEADRRGCIRTISLTVGADSIDPATGRPVRTTLVAVAADRERFLACDLANVVPAETLKLFNAVVSKNPFDLVGIDSSQGVRG
jgi:restriction system protein